VASFVFTSVPRTVAQEGVPTGHEVGKKGPASAERYVGAPKGGIFRGKIVLETHEDRSKILQRDPSRS
jgi:hypothetical protein